MRTMNTIMGELRAKSDKARDLKREAEDIKARLEDSPNDAGLEERAKRIAAGLNNIADEVKELQREGGQAAAALDPAFVESGDGNRPVGATSGRTSSPSALAALRSIEASHNAGAIPDQGAERASSLVEHGPAASREVGARWIAATADPDYMGAFMKLAADPQRGHLLWDTKEANAFRKVAEVRNAMTIGTDGDGGFLVPFTLDPSVILTSDGSTNPLRQVSRVQTIATDTWHGVASDGVTAAWYAEAAEVTDDSPTLTQPSIPVHRGSAWVPFSFEVAQDSAGDFRQNMGRLLTDAADQLMAAAYTTGSGSGQPTGIITALDGTASEVAPTTTETFAAADIYKTIEALPPRFQPRARWQANLATGNTIDQFETSNGSKQFPDLGEGRLLRAPIDQNSNMRGTSDVDTGATADNHILLVGDFEQFVIVDRIGTTVEFVPHLVGANQRPTGQRGFLMWFRTGSDVTSINAFRALNVATTA